MSELRIADSLRIPMDAVTQTFAILAKRGAGKTHTAVVLAEELLRAGLHVVVLDPLDVWWGLRSSKNGKEPGYPITVIGGNHADLPLEASAGAVLAEFVVHHRHSIILSLRHLSMGEQRRFVTDFCEKLFHLKGREEHRQPLHLIVDEADEFAPQRVMAGHERMFGALDRIVRRGRAAGLGVTLISQRAAVLNKDVLTQIEVLIALRTVSPQDRKALEAWIDAHDAHDQRADFMASLASLAIGEAWIWSPGWLDLFVRRKIRDRHTFDSSATPKVGGSIAAPKKAAEVDLAQLREAMAATIERAKEEDPKLLRARIIELERTCIQAQQKLQSMAASPAASEQQLERAREEGRREVKAQLQPKTTLLQTQLDGFLKHARRTMEEISALDQKLSVPPPTPAWVRPAPVPLPDPEPRKAKSSNGLGIRITGGERRILIALAQYPSGRTKIQVALLTGYAHNGGGFNNYLSSLRGKSFLEGSGEQLRITDVGLAALGSYEPLPRGRDLLAHWLGQLEKAPRLILQTLAEVSPATLSKEQLAQKTGYEANGGGFNNALSRLRTLELISGRGPELRASEDLLQ